MAQYKVLATSWIGDKLRQPGEIIEYAGIAGSNLKKLDKKKDADPKPEPAQPAPDGDGVI